MDLTRRHLALAAIALAATGAVGWALAGPVHPASPTDPAIPVRAVTVPPLAAGDALSGTVSRYAARIHYDREATLSFRLPGTITRLAVREGDVLGAGALVATLDDTGLRAGVDRQSADFARLGREARRLTGLASDGAAAPADADQAGDSTRAAAAGLASARFDLAASRLVAPFAGLVLSRSAERGETVAAGQAIVRLADRASPLVAMADVPAAMVAGLAAGQSAEVTADGRILAGRIWRIAGGADGASGLVTVTVRLAPGTGLASGTPASVSFGSGPTNANTEGVVRLPAEALLDASGERASVLVIDAGGHARRQAVRFLGFDDRYVRVAGLAPGVRVVTAGAGFVGEGQRVAVIGA